MYCTNCGAPMPEQDRFCRYCGAPGIETRSCTPPPPPMPPMGYPGFAGNTQSYAPMQPGQIPMPPAAYPPPWMLPPLPPPPHVGWTPESVKGKAGSRIVPVIAMVCLAGAGFALFLLL